MNFIKTIEHFEDIDLDDPFPKKKNHHHHHHNHVIN
jgi:hypothetical protein